MSSNSVRNRALLARIEALLQEEIASNPVTYNAEIPYQAYERIGFEGRRWSVEKRIVEYGLDAFFDPDHAVLDIGSNFGFVAVEFALHCREVHGVEPNRWLNQIAMITAEHLGVADRVRLFDAMFEDFEAPIHYDLVLSLAAFFTQDGRERSTATRYFKKASALTKPGGHLFYESTSYTKPEGSPAHGHFVAKQEALDAIGAHFEAVRQWETASGAEGYFRQFAIGRKG